MNAETIHTITECATSVGIACIFIYLITVVRGVYNDFGKPIDEHTEKIAELEKRLTAIGG